VRGPAPSVLADRAATAPVPSAALTIGEVARRTGLSTSTLRAWERRYGVLRPDRSAGGHRRYGILELDRVRAVQHLISEGWSTEAAATAVGRDLPAPTSPALPDPAPNGPGPTTSADGMPPVPSAPFDRWGPVDGRPAPDLTAIGSGARGPLVDDTLGLAAAHRAACRLIRLEDVEDAPAVLVDLVSDLGGIAVPADEAPADALPVDLGLGIVPPLVPVGDAPVARVRLERVLPPVVEDARRMVTLLRLAGLDDGLG
jgi:hypothetical protein